MVQEKLCGKQMKRGSFDKGAEVILKVLLGFSSAKWFAYNLEDKFTNRNLYDVRFKFI